MILKINIRIYLNHGIDLVVFILQESSPVMVARWDFLLYSREAAIRSQEASWRLCSKQTEVSSCLPVPQSAGRDSGSCSQTLHPQLL